MENLHLEAENIEDKADVDQRAIGAKLLSQVGIRHRYEAVDESFDKARKREESLPGKNDERRTFAYLSRLENIINKHGNKVEKRLWNQSVTGDLLVKPKNITEAYWENHKQELRDNGYGNIKVNDSYKQRHAKELAKLQAKSLQYWTDYLSDENCPYPLWFKVYAFDGLIKMGQYNKVKKRYEARNETTTAAYPGLDAEVLACVFEVVNKYHGHSEREFFRKDGNRDVELEKLVQSGNFSKIYSAIQRDIAPVLEPPENSEDVHGEWVEYTVNEVNDIARAAAGTGWCIASQAVARHYLLYGNYGGNDYDDYDHDSSQQRGDVGKARFLLFHLQDSEAEKFTRTACASVRLGLGGNVAEISGLRGGQALHDSLIDVVEEKVMALPGGERFIEAFADKKELIRLDHKMQNGEDMTKEELEFIYEINRDIKTLDTYNRRDPRVKELRATYNVEYALGKGMSVDTLVSKMSPPDIAKNLDILMSHGANIDSLVSRLSPNDVDLYYDTLMSHGANIDSLVSRLSPYDIAQRLDTLMSHGANIDSLVSRLSPYDIAQRLDTLMSHGANIDVNKLVAELSPWEVSPNLEILIRNDANVDDLVFGLMGGYLNPQVHQAYIENGDLQSALLIEEAYRGDYVKRELSALIAHGADFEKVASRLNKYLGDNLLNALRSRSTDE